MMNREVRTVMDREPITVDPNLTVEELSQMMLSRKVQQLPVVEDGKFKGLITSYDLWRRYEHNNSIGSMKVKDVMNTKVIKISPKDKLGTAAELFADRRFKTLPVVNLQNELKGMITAFDIIKVVYNDEYTEKILFKEEFAM